MRQLETGDLLGVSGAFDRDLKNQFPVLVEQVAEGSFASRHGVVPGDRIRVSWIQSGDSELLRFAKGDAGKAKFDRNWPTAVLQTQAGASITVPINALPDRSARTHPTQIYSAIKASVCFDADLVSDWPVLNGVRPTRRSRPVRNRVHDFSAG